jgi:hypothetical protein
VLLGLKKHKLVGSIRAGWSGTGMKCTHTFKGRHLHQKGVLLLVALFCIMLPHLICMKHSARQAGWLTCHVVYVKIDKSED